MEMRRTSRGAARLRNLADAAADLFLEQGYDAVSLDTLIARVGGSRRNIYDHFGGKEGLFIEAVTQRCIDLGGPLMALEIRGEEAKAALNLFGCCLLEIVLQPRTLALQRLMIAEGQRFPDLAQAIWRAGYHNASRILAPWIEYKQSCGELRADLPAEDLAAQFVSLVVSAPQMRGLVGLLPDLVPQEYVARMVESAVALFLRGAFLGKAENA